MNELPQRVWLAVRNDWLAQGRSVAQIGIWIYEESELDAWRNDPGITVIEYMNVGPRTADSRLAEISAKHRPGPIKSPSPHLLAKQRVVTELHCHARIPIPDPGCYCDQVEGSCAHCIRLTQIKRVAHD